MCVYPQDPKQFRTESPPSTSFDFFGGQKDKLPTSLLRIPTTDQRNDCTQVNPGETMSRLGLLTGSDRNMGDSGVAASLISPSHYG